MPDHIDHIDLVGVVRAEPVGERCPRLVGAQYRRRLLWRYSIVWDKPA